MNTLKELMPYASLVTSLHRSSNQGIYVNVCRNKFSGGYPDIDIKGNVASV
jgi:hypothetical protein